MDQAQQLRNVIKSKNLKKENSARVITITSGKGGVGKSNLAVNLATQFRKKGLRVIILDVDFGLANIEIMFGVVPKHNLSSMLFQGKGIKEIVSTGPMDIGFISGGNGVLGLNNLNREQIMYLIKNIGELNEMADVIIVDTGAGISDQVLEFLLASPEVLLVTTPEPSSLTDSYSVLKALYRNPNFVQADTKIRVVANRAQSVSDGQMVYNKLKSVVEQFLNGSIDYLGMVPQDTELEQAVRQQKIVSIHAPFSKSARAFEALATTLLAGTQQAEPARRGIAQIFSRLLKNRE